MEVNDDYLFSSTMSSIETAHEADIEKLQQEKLLGEALGSSPFAAWKTSIYQGGVNESAD